jgi:putative oxidoreductase
MPHSLSPGTVDILLLIGRIIVGGYFLFGAFNHFANVKMMAGYARSKGTPAAEAAVAGTGVLLLLGGLSILLGYHPTIGACLLVIFLLGVTFQMHAFWKAGPEERMVQMVNFTKNMALLGFVLMTIAIPRPWAYSLGS